MSFGLGVAVRQRDQANQWPEETKSHSVLASLGLAPPLLASFRNGLIYEFIPGRVCTAEDLTKESVWRGVAKKLGEWHARLPISSLTKSKPHSNGHSVSHQEELSSEWNAQLNSTLSGLPTPNVWTVMQKWIHALPGETSDECKRNATLLEELLRTVSDLAHLPGLGDSGFVFSHNDLLSGNVIINARSYPKSQMVEEVSFIDYEYSAPAPAACDLANHFAEWGGFECKYQQLPTRSQRRGFIEEYLRSYYVHKDLGVVTNGNSHAAGYQESPDSLFETVDRFRGVPGLYWGIWALIQATISDIDFDYTSYAERRLGEYWAWRAEEEGTRVKQGQDMPLRERRWSEE